MDKQKPTGSGVLLTFDGFLVTAAHILVGDLNPPLRLSYFARFSEEEGANPNPWIGASLKKIDRDLDLALLKLDEFPERPPMRAMRSPLAGLVPGTEICLSGFGLRKDGNNVLRNGFSTVSSSLHDPEDGYIIPEVSVQSGFSGGGVFREEALAGLILRRRIPSGSYVIPISHVNDFIGSVGIYLNDDAEYTSGIPPQELRTEVQGNRRSIDENRRQLALILRSMHWDIELASSEAGRYGLILKARRAFPDQVLDGYFLVELEVHFDEQVFRDRVEKGEEIYKAVVAVEITGGEIMIDDIDEEVREIIARYLSEGLNFQASQISKFIVSWQIAYQGWSRKLITKEILVAKN